jgi:hypothetical protein
MFLTKSFLYQELMTTIHLRLRLAEDCHSMDAADELQNKIKISGLM